MGVKDRVAEALGLYWYAQRHGFKRSDPDRLDTEADGYTLREGEPNS
jgi:hypothetical protein